jgi:prephenate dehydratase
MRQHDQKPIARQQRIDLAMHGERPLVAYQGTRGAFGEAAVRQLWRRARVRPVRTFAGAVSAAAHGDVAWAVIPVWNSTIGIVATGSAAVDAHRDSVTRVHDVDVAVRHCLLARAGTAMGDLKFIGSHPAALAQCASLFASLPGAIGCEASDTAGAARDLARFGRAPARHRAPNVDLPWYAGLGVGSPRQLGVIASARAARLYGLSVLEFDVHDEPDNYTRFAVLTSSSVIGGAAKRRARRPEERRQATP